MIALQFSVLDADISIAGVELWKEGGQREGFLGSGRRGGVREYRCAGLGVRARHAVFRMPGTRWGTRWTPVQEHTSGGGAGERVMVIPSPGSPLGDHWDPELAMLPVSFYEQKWTLEVVRGLLFPVWLLTNQWGGRSGDTIAGHGDGLGLCCKGSACSHAASCPGWEPLFYLLCPVYLLSIRAGEKLPAHGAWLKSLCVTYMYFFSGFSETLT